MEIEKEIRDARARLRALIRACLGVATEDGDFWTVFIAFWGETLRDPELAGLNARTYEKARRWIAALVGRGISEGVFRRVDVRPASIAILAVLDGVALQLTFDKTLLSPRAAERLCEDTLLRYLSSDGGDR